ncbi:MAG: hypothetical protein E7283_02065 [Lachnospiraceae bacterium]|nr:hypothetical protein [Lachnospiraceae bacterium]
MLQSIQYSGGVPTYIYSNNAASASNGFFHVYASQMAGHDPQRKKEEVKSTAKKREKTNEEKEKYLRDSYERGYREQELLRWN